MFQKAKRYERIARLGICALALCFFTFPGGANHLIGQADARPSKKPKKANSPTVERTKNRKAVRTPHSASSSRLARVSNEKTASSKSDATSNLSLLTPRVRSTVVSSYQRAIAGRIGDPIKHLKTLYSERIFSQETPSGLSELEDDVLDVFRIPPIERRKLWSEIEAAVQEKYDLDPNAWLSVFSYYAEHVFGNDEGILGKKHQETLRSHAEELRRVLALSEPQTPTHARYHYYLANLRRKSAPEMAAELRISQGNVYADLSVLSLSRVKAFAEKPSRSLQRRIVKRLADAKTEIDGCTSDCAVSFLTLAKRLYAKNWSREKIAKTLDLGGSGALVYFLHPNGVPRGSDWTEMVKLPSQPEDIPEAAALLSLHQSGWIVKDIAVELNRIKKVSDPSSDRYRTEKQVRDQLNHLKVKSRSKTLFPRDHRLARRYGVVKKNGILQTDSVKRYVYDHVRRSTLPEMAAALKVSVNTLRRFIAKHHLPFPATRRGQDEGTDARVKEALTAYKQTPKPGLPAGLRRRTSEEAMANAMGRIRHNGGKPPHSKKPAAKRSDVEKQDTAAAKFIRDHQWTKAEVDALSELERSVIEPIFRKQQSGEKRKVRSPKESMDNALARIRHHKGKPPESSKPSAKRSEAENLDTAAARYIRTHKWTQAEVDALPELERGVIKPAFDKQQRGEKKKKRTKQESISNVLARIQLHKKKPPQSRKPAAKQTEAERLDTAAGWFIGYHKWTQAEVDALPELARSIIEPVFNKQQRGEKRQRRTTAESIASATARIRHHNGKPPQSKTPAAKQTKAEELDTAAYQFIQRHKWTRQEVDALPELARSIIEPVFDKQQRGKKNKYLTAKEAMDNALARVRHHSGNPPKSSKPKAKRSETEDLDTLAIQFIRRYKWTQAEVDALPELERSVIEPIFHRQQARK